jgi:hypothetical protein
MLTLQGVLKEYFGPSIPVLGVLDELVRLDKVLQSQD